VITPNKAITLDQSTMSRLAVILRVGSDPIDVVSLFHSVDSQFESIDQFLVTLDTLFVLGKVQVDFRTRILSYVD
jgi:hypothetical protein